MTGATSPTAATGEAAEPTETASESAAVPEASARTNGDSTPYATRSVEPTRVRPGGTAHVTVTLPSASGRVVLRDGPSVGSVSLDGVSPDPLQRITADGHVYVLWEFDDGARAEVEYTLTVPEELADGDAVEFDGELLLPDYVVPIAGPDAAPVTTDIVGAILAGDRVNERAVADAGRHLTDGAIDAAAFERVYHAWLDEHASEQPVSDADTAEQGPATNGQSANGQREPNGDSPPADGSAAPDSREQPTDEHRPGEGESHDE